MNDKTWTVFMAEHNLCGMERYCMNDERYEMRFATKDGKKVEFHCSRADIAAKYGDEPKDASVAHFEQMAMAWYAEKCG